MDNSGHACGQDSECFIDDINMVCKENRCQCKSDMKYNSIAQECQVNFYCLR